MKLKITKEIQKYMFDMSLPQWNQLKKALVEKYFWISLVIFNYIEWAPGYLLFLFQSEPFEWTAIRDQKLRYAQLVAQITLQSDWEIPDPPSRSRIRLRPREHGSLQLLLYGYPNTCQETLSIQINNLPLAGLYECWNGWCFRPWISTTVGRVSSWLHVQIVRAVIKKSCSRCRCMFLNTCGLFICRFELISSLAWARYAKFWMLTALRYVLVL